MRDHKQAIKDIYKIAGILESLSLMEGSTITAGIAADLADAVDKLEIIGAELTNERYEIKLDYHLPGRMVDLIGNENGRINRCDERPMKKVVKVHEGTEEPGPEPPTADQ